VPFEKGETTVVKENRFREYTRSVWHQSYDAIERYQQPWRDQATSAVQALLTELRRYSTEDKLHDSYWQVGDWPGAFLLRHLPFNPGPDSVLELEEAAFWLRSQELAEAAQ
jgi:hypothetical protein